MGCAWLRDAGVGDLVERSGGLDRWPVFGDSWSMGGLAAFGRRRDVGRLMLFGELAEMLMMVDGLGGEAGEGAWGERRCARAWKRGNEAEESIRRVADGHSPIIIGAR